jgi:adapter protein MecA 1/2
VIILKIEKISENKIKVTISLDDLIERNIDLDSLNYNSPAAQELFWDMMEQAEVEFGFNISDSQLVIEPIPDMEEGFIITITKLDEDGDFESIHKYIKNRYKKSDLKSKRKGRKVYTSVCIYSFSSFDDLCELSKMIQHIYSGESTLYKYKATYYLLLTRSNFTVSNIKLFDILMSEYGSKVSNASFYEGYLNEYGEKIATSDAIEIINTYF